MGEASRRKARHGQEAAALARVDLPLILNAVQRFTAAASGQPTVDCTIHAKLVQALLADAGVAAAVCAGHAAWRVGEQPHAVVAHHPAGNPGQLPVENGAMFHAWVECGGVIIDSTLLTLIDKVRQLDAFDGLRTRVQWYPAYLVAAKADGTSFAAVRDGRTPGLFHYRRVPACEPRWLDYALDANDLATPRTVLAMLRTSPAMVVIGPHSAAGAGQPTADCPNARALSVARCDEALLAP